MRNLKDSIFNPDDCLFINKNFIKQYNPTYALLLAFLLKIEKKEADKEGWFPITFETLSNELGLSPFIQKNAIKDFEKLGILEKKIKGYPGKRHIRLNHEKIKEMYGEEV